ncbi:MAG: hypothetical protein M0Z75_16735 [Nitrospiraceae bacterium]|nr:hypothetical protein [Nitrospiraceae bacterium]
MKRALLVIDVQNEYDVSSNDELNALLTEWTNIIPASFDIYPLASPIESERLLK